MNSAQTCLHYTGHMRLTTGDPFQIKIGKVKEKDQYSEVRCVVCLIFPILSLEEYGFNRSVSPINL